MVRPRLAAPERAARERVLNAHVDQRGTWMRSHWGQPGLAWELLPLRDPALRRIDAGDRGGYLLADNIATPLLYTGRTLDVREL